MFSSTLKSIWTHDRHCSQTSLTSPRIPKEIITGCPPVKGDRGAFKTLRFNCRGDLVFSHQRSTRRDLLKLPLLRVTSHDLVFSHCSLRINARTASRIFFIGLSRTPLGAGRPSYLQELATKASWLTVGGQPPAYIFFLNIVF